MPRKLFTALCGGVCMCTLATPATAAPVGRNAASPHAAGWIRYALPQGVNAALTTPRVIQGHRVGPTCNFTQTRTLARGTRGQEADEVAFNPATCQAIYDFGPIQTPAEVDDLASD